MRKLHLLALAGTLLAGGTAAQMAAHASPDETQRAVMRLECEWGQAYTHGDVNAIRRLEAAGYVGISPDGTTSTLESDISDVTSGKLKYTQLLDGAMQVRVYGNTAVATGRSLAAGTYDGNPFQGTYAWVDTWVQRNGAWQVAAEGVVKVADPNTALQHVDGQCEEM